MSDFDDVRVVDKHAKLDHWNCSMGSPWNTTVVPGPGVVGAVEETFTLQQARTH